MNLNLFKIIFFSLALAASCRRTTDSPLFKISENHKIGFIDTAGQVVIRPTFWAAGDFSEGLAAARLKGTYGYIDQTGRFVIPPQFDYATAFSEGLSIVYNNGQPFFINKQGQKPFDMDFPIVEPFKNGRAKVQTATKKFGFIDQKGQLAIDTVFSRIDSFIDGVAVVEGVNHCPYGCKERGIKSNYEVGIIDTLGHFLIPYGQYKEISDLSNGYFKIETLAEPWDTIDEYTCKTGFLDRSGKLIFAKKFDPCSWLEGDVHSGLARVNLYKYWLQKETAGAEMSFSTEHIYEGFINLKGEIIINDTTYRSMGDFYFNRAFAEDEDGNVFIIDPHGKRISKDTFAGFAGEGFDQGMAFVKKNGKYGIIDTNGTFILQPRFEDIDVIDLKGGYFFFQRPNEDPKSIYSQLYGIGKIDGSILFEPIIEEFEEGCFQNGLLKCRIQGRLTYLNKRGKMVWQESERSMNQLTDLNIDFMNWGYFEANSVHDPRGDYMSGAPKNFPQSNPDKTKFTHQPINVAVYPDLKDTIYGNVNAITVWVANTSDKQVAFEAQDSRLYMKVQAKNTKDEWEDIEHLPSSWCGNSYHTLTLDPAQHWRFATPVYKGAFKTQLRIELKYLDPTYTPVGFFDKKEVVIHSNTYSGSVNPGQFWRKQDYMFNGPMDSYTN